MALAAPTDVSAVRQSDIAIDIAWTNNSTPEAPYQSLSVQRWSSDIGLWVTIKSLFPGLTRYTDKTTQKNRAYRYRVLASNSSLGDAVSAASTTVYTTPAMPSGVKASRPVSDVVLTWTDMSSYESGFRIYESQDGAAFSLIATLGVGVESYTALAPSGTVSHQYEVTAFRDDLESPAAVSDVLQPIAPPLTPTEVRFSSAISDAEEDLVLYWKHNPVDSTSQTAYEVRYRLDTDADWAALPKTTSSEQQCIIPAGTMINGKEYEIEVCTYGQDPASSPWSDTLLLVTSSRPTATINSPVAAAIIPGPSVTVTWGYYDAEGTTQSAYKVVLYAADGTTALWSSTAADASTSAEIAYTLADGAAYVIGVSVCDTSGQWHDGLWSAEARVSVTVDYASPPTPAVDVSYDQEAGSATIAVFNPEPGSGELDTINNRVYRSIDGVEELVAAVAKNGTCTDPTPALGRTNVYRVEAWSALPSATISPLVELAVPAGAYCFFNWGPGYALIAHLAANVSFGGDVAPEQRYYAPAGRKYPLLMTGDARDAIITCSGELYEDPDQEEAFNALADYGREVIYRDMRGHRLLVGAAVKVSESAGPRIVRVDVDMRRIG